MFTCGSQAADSYIKYPAIVQLSTTKQVKILSLLAELPILARLAAHPHPHIAQFRGVVVEQGWIVGLVFKKYHDTLAEALTRCVRDDEPFQAGEATLRAITAAVAHLHSLNIVHVSRTPPPHPRHYAMLTE